MGVRRVPRGWIKAGSTPQFYDVGVLKNTDGRSAAYIKGLRPTNGFGTLMQTISAEAYLGKRIRFTAVVQSDGVQGWAGLWARVDGEQGKVLAFDNMEKRPIRWATEPARYSVVLDVPASAKRVSYGILLEGGGGTHPCRPSPRQRTSTRACAAASLRRPRAAGPSPISSR